MERKLKVFHCLVEERKMRGSKENRMGIFQRAHQIFLSQLERKWERKIGVWGALKSKDFFLCQTPLINRNNLKLVQRGKKEQEKKHHQIQFL
jgi:hypothetical protein